MAMVQKKTCAMESHVQPLLPFFNAAAQRSKHPDLPRLQPDKLIRVVYLPLPVQTSEEAAALAIYGVAFPKRDYIIQQGTTI